METAELTYRYGLGFRRSLAWILFWIWLGRTVVLCRITFALEITIKSSDSCFLPPTGSSYVNITIGGGLSRQYPALGGSILSNYTRNFAFSVCLVTMGCPHRRIVGGVKERGHSWMPLQQHCLQGIQIYLKPSVKTCHSSFLHAKLGCWDLLV